jgi:N4-gp56 family major capsid protein
MATGNTAYGDISPRVGIIASAIALKHAAPIIVLGKLGQVMPVPKNGGQVVKFRGPKTLATATTPLTEFVTPTAQKLEYRDVTVNLARYGSWSAISDDIADTHEDPVLKDMMEISGEQAAETMEMIDYGVLIGGTNFVRANGTARNQINTKLTLTLQRKVVRMLRSQRAPKIRKIQDGSIKIGTSPIEAAYVAVCHTDLEADIRGLAGFVPVAKYGTREPICMEEIGSVEDVRYITSPLLNPWIDAGGAHGNNVLSTGGTSADVYPILYLAENAFGTVGLKGDKAFQPMVLNPNTPRGGDPMGRQGSVAWKTWHACVILDPTRLVRLEVGASVL